MDVLALQFAGIDFASGTTWFVVAVAGVVIALTVTTRRGNTRPRTFAPLAEAPPSASSGDGFAAAQALFVDDPRAGVERAQAVVVRALAARAAGRETDAGLMERYRTACAAAANPLASVDDLRAALLDLRAVYRGLDDESASRETHG